jgi:hypothetical protein
VKAKAHGALAKEPLLGATRASEPAASPQPAPELPRLAAAGSPCPTATGVPLPKGPAGPASHGSTDELQASGRGPRGASSSSAAPPARRSSASLATAVSPVSDPDSDLGSAGGLAPSPATSAPWTADTAASRRGGGSKQSLHILLTSQTSADFRPLRLETARPERTATNFNHSKRNAPLAA